MVSTARRLVRLFLLVVVAGLSSSLLPQHACHAFVVVTHTTATPYWKKNSQQRVASIITTRRQQQQRRQRQGRSGALAASVDASTTTTTTSSGPTLHVVVLGVGDLRLDDHGGLYQALQQQQQLNNDRDVVLPVCLLDHASLANLPGLLAHTHDTAHCLAQALHELQHAWTEQATTKNGSTTPTPALHFCWNCPTIAEALEPTCRHWMQQQQHHSTTSSICIHACDLGPADEEMAYGPHAQLVQQHQTRPAAATNDKTTTTISIGGTEATLHSWTCRLRDEPWTVALQQSDSSAFPNQYPTYAQHHVTQCDALPALDSCQLVARMATTSTTKVDTSAFSPEAPTTDQVLRDLQRLASQQSTLMEEDDTTTTTVSSSTGLFLSHWGGLPCTTVGCRTALKIVEAYTEVGREASNGSGSAQFDWVDAQWSQHALYPGRSVQRNGYSLEHAAMIWQLQGTGQAAAGTVGNWMAGEAMIRFLAAPLLLGTVSPRRLWHLAAATASPPVLPWNKGSSVVSPIQQRMEEREWHQLLAASNLVSNPTAYPSSSTTTTTTNTNTSYRYWRYQGFLCRYAVTPLSSSSSPPQQDVSSSSSSSNPHKQGLLLVHGFGASGAQWNKLLASIQQQQQQQQQANKDDPTQSFLQQGLAPDLLGFGQSEKPAVSYTGYLWDSQVLDFIRERAARKSSSSSNNDKHKGGYEWTKFVVGGNSIGGYTSMCVAASDSLDRPSSSSFVAPPDSVAHGTAASDKNNNDKRTSRLLTSSGAPGTSMCNGLVLMNSAGPIKTQDEMEQEFQQAQSTRSKDYQKSLLPYYSIAQVTSADALPPCQPPWRPLSRWFGQGLLWYLRPRIAPICVNLYPTNPAAVNDELCGNIERDSLDPGAVNVMMAGAKLPIPRTANEVLNGDFKMGWYPCSNSAGGGDGSSTTTLSESVFSGPVLIAQGVLDPLNDAQDRLERFGALRPGITMDGIQAGHCPHDEQPNLVASSILQWYVKQEQPAETARKTTTVASS